MIRLKKDLVIKKVKKRPKKALVIPLIKHRNKNYIKLTSIKELFRSKYISEIDRRALTNLYRDLLEYIAETIKEDTKKEVIFLKKSGYVYVCLEHKNDNRRRFRALQKSVLYWKDWLIKEFEGYTTLTVSDKEH